MSVQDPKKAQLVQEINNLLFQQTGCNLTQKEVSDYMKRDLSSLKFELSRLKFQDAPDLSCLY